MELAWKPVFNRLDLPVFYNRQEDRTLYYTPGWVAVVPASSAAAFHAALLSPGENVISQAVELRRLAQEAADRWHARKAQRYQPVCLTLYLNNNCNLDCIYCFSKPSRNDQDKLSLETIEAAAEMVAQNCRQQGLPFTVAFHGGGEPTLESELIDQAIAKLEKIATKHGLSLYRYLATNGVLSPAKARHIAQQFDLIGLSCDGPPEIQDAQRPTVGGAAYASARYVEQTAQAVHAFGKPLHVRVTVTPQSMHRQPQIAAYICETLHPAEIHVEPVYTQEDGHAAHNFSAQQAPEFVDWFMQARDVAAQYGVGWQASGTRPWDMHYTYCHLDRNVLNLTPQGIATACFKESDAQALRQKGLAVGQLYPGGFGLDYLAVTKLQNTIAENMDDCQGCFNRYHCARSCPDHCIIEQPTRTGDFRCQTQWLLANALIGRTADRLAAPTNEKIVLGEVTPF